jgi:hypothetical protein
MSPERSVKDFFGPYTLDWLAEEAVMSELLSATNKEKYRENSRRISILKGKSTLELSSLSDVTADL